MKALKWLIESTSFARSAAVILLASVIYWFVPIQSRAVVQAQGKGGSEVQFVRSGLVYVPIYSSIFYENGKHTLELAATLNLHNVNPDTQIQIVRADYYNTAGRLIKKYVDRPLVLNPLQTNSIVIEKADTSGGTGANFLVEWQSDHEAVSPLIEAVMVNASSNLGIAFTTTGKVVRQASVSTK